jgi:hypothetical protein
MPRREPSPIPENRPLSPEEHSLTRWMLEHGHPDAAAFLPQLDRARVVSRCPCGCASIDFAIDGEQAPPGTGMQVLGDFLYGDEKTLCGAFVFAKAGLLAGLEVYGLAVDAPTVLPEPPGLRRKH